jgi:hypothetical protein
VVHDREFSIALPYVSTTFYIGPAVIGPGI